MQTLRNYDWPGNIRELQNAVRQAVLKTSGPALLPAFLPEFVRENNSSSRRERTTTPREGREEGGSPDPNATDRSSIAAASAGNVTHFKTDPTGLPLSQDELDLLSPYLYDEVIGKVEQRLVAQVLEHTGGDKEEAARRLGINPALLRSRAALELLELGSLHDNGHATPLIRPGMTMAEIETEAIRRALAQTDGCRKAAAKLLGISTRTMQRRVKDLGI